MAEFFRRDLPEPGFDTADFSRIQGLRGIVLNPDALSGGAVQLDARGVQAMGEGAARFGQGVASVGSDMMAVAEEQMRAVAVRQETDAENAMTDAEGKIQVAITAEQDETKWRGLAEQHIASFEESLNGREMTAAARDAIRMKVAGWKNQVGHFVGMASARRSVERAREGIAAKATRLMESGDYGGLGTLLQQPGTAHFMGQDWVAGQEVAAVRMAKAKAKEAEFNANYDAIQENPEAWKAANQKRPEGRDAAVHDRLLAEADSVIHRTVEGIGDRLTNSIITGEIKTPAEVDGWEADNPRITPAMRESARNLVMRRNDATAREAMVARAPEIASRLRSEAKAYDPKRDSYETYIALRMRIAELPPGVEGDVSQILERKNPDRIAEMKPPATLAELGDDLLDSMFREGRFGSFDNGTGKDAAGEPVEPGSPREEYVRNEKQYREALTTKAKIGGDFAKWLMTNPNADEKAVKAKIAELMPEGTRVRYLDALEAASAAATPAVPQTAAGTGDNIDLPGGAGAPTGPGIMPPLDAPAPDSSGAVWVSDASGTAEVVPMGADDIARWKEAGGKPSRVWDSMASKFVTIPADKLIPGRHFMPAGFLPQ